MSGLIVEKPATNLPVTLDEMKSYLRLEINNDDTLISMLISGATEACEIFTRRSFINKGFLMTLDAFPYFTDTAMSQLAYPPAYYSLPRYSTTLWNYSQMIKLFRPPLVSVERITYLSSGDNQFHDLVQAPPLWYPGNVYASGALIVDNNVNVQKCTTPGTSSANPPIWNKTTGGTTTEVGPDATGEGTGVVWTNQGPLSALLQPPNNSNGAGATTAQFGAFIVSKVPEPARIFPGPPGNFWPPVLYVPDAVQIHYTAGYGTDSTKVPDGIRMAIMQYVADFYENREPIGKDGQIPPHIRALLWNYRVLDIAPTRG